MLRRTMLKALSGLAAFTIAKPQIVNAEKAIEVLPESNLVSIPDWCPKGFIPMLGQKITPEQFPGLFEPTKLANGRDFYPIFWRKKFGILEELPVKEILDFQQPKLDEDGHIIIKDRKIVLEEVGDIVSIAIIAVEPFRWSNGAIAPPGFQDKITVSKDKFESFYEGVK